MNNTDIENDIDTDTAQQRDEQLWHLVEQFIETANELSQTIEPGLIAAALTDAAAQYSAFVLAGTALDKKAMLDDKEEAFNGMTKQYKSALGDAIRYHLDHYDEMFGKNLDE